MTRELKTGRKGPARGEAERIVVLLHGYGADGNDLLGLADPLMPHMPGTAFLGQCPAFFGQEYRPVRRTGQVAVAFEGAQVLGQHPLGDVPDGAFQGAEALRPLFETKEDEDLPFAGDPGHDLANGAVFGLLFGKGGYLDHT